MLGDLRYAVRRLGRARTFPFVAIVSLAVGIGLNTTAFSIVYGVLIQSLPYPNADRIIALARRGPGISTPSARRVALTIGEYEEWEGHARVLESSAIFASNQLSLGGAGQPGIIAVAGVSPRFFDVFETAPIIGRAWQRAEPAGAVVLISERIWDRRFGRDPSAVGRPLTLNGVQCDVIGVMPATFGFPADRIDAWVPLDLWTRIGGSELRDRGVFQFVGRLRPSVTQAQAEDDVRRVGAELVRDGAVGLHVIRIQDDLVSQVRTPLLLALATSGLTLLILCANLANLLLARSTHRIHEFAVRAALGADRYTLMRQVLVEGALLGAVGTGLALPLTWLMLWSVRAWRPEGLPHIDAVSISMPVLWFSVATGLLASIVFAAVPTAIAVWNAPVAELLTVWSPAARRQHWWNHVFLVTEIALAVILTTSAGVLTRSFLKLLAIDVGIDVGNVLVMQVNLPQNMYQTPEQQRDFFGRFVERVRNLPGVRDAGVGTAVPPSRSYIQINPPTKDDAGQVRRLLVDLVPVSDGFLPAVGARLKRGRLFTASDTESESPVAIVSERVATLLLANRDPLGASLPVGRLPMPGHPRTAIVVGVVGDVRYSGLETPPDGAVYVPFRQRPLATAFVAVATEGPPQMIAASVQTIIRDLDPALSAADLRTLRDVTDESMVQPRSRALLAGGMAALALLLSAAGVYTVSAYAVSRRIREVGIRLALGASGTDVIVLFVAQTARVAAVGLVIGVAGAMAMSGWLQSLVYGVGGRQIPELILAAALNGALAAAAVFIAVRGATTVNPALILRTE